MIVTTLQVWPYSFRALYKQQEFFFLGTLEHMNSQTHQNFLSRHSNGKSYISDCALLFQNLHPRHKQWRIEWGAIDSWQGSCGLLLCRVVECVQWQYDIDLIACIYRLHCVCITMYYIDLTLWYGSVHIHIYEKIIPRCLHHMEYHIHPIIHDHNLLNDLKAGLSAITESLAAVKTESLWFFWNLSPLTVSFLCVLRTWDSWEFMYIYTIMYIMYIYILIILRMINS